MSRIIIADSQPLFREGIAAIIAQIAARTGHTLQCEQAHSLAALMVCRDNEEDADVVILDLSLLRGHGRSDLLAVRSRLPAMLLGIFAPAYDTDIGTFSISVGISGLISRAANRREISLSLEKLLAQGGGKAVQSLPAAADAAGPNGAVAIAVGRPSIQDEQDRAALSLRQADVLDLVKEGKSNKQIAWELSISETTVKAHMTAILRKLGVNSRAQAIVLLQRQAWRGGMPRFGRTSLSTPHPILG